MHITYRATVTATLHMGHMSAKTGKQCQFGQDTFLYISYNNMQSKKFSCKFHLIRGIGRACYIQGHCNSHVTYGAT